MNLRSHLRRDFGCSRHCSNCASLCNCVRQRFLAVDRQSASKRHCSCECVRVIWSTDHHSINFDRTRLNVAVQKSKVAITLCVWNSRRRHVEHVQVDIAEGGDFHELRLWSRIAFCKEFIQIVHPTPTDADARNSQRLITRSSIFCNRPPITARTLTR